MVGRKRLLLCGGLGGGFRCRACQAAGRGGQPFETAVLPFVKQYCLDCHSGADAERGVQLDKYRTAAAVAEDRATWRKVQSMLRAGKMPPKDSRRPKEAEIGAVTAWLESTLGPLPEETGGSSAPPIRGG